LGVLGSIDSAGSNNCSPIPNSLQTTRISQRTVAAVAPGSGRRRRF